MFELNVNGTFRTIDSSDIQSYCLDGYRDGLRTSGSVQLLNLNAELADLRFCQNVNDVSVTSFGLSLSSLGIYVSQILQFFPVNVKYM